MERLLINRDGINPATGKLLTNSRGEPLGNGAFFLKSDPQSYDNEILFRPIAAWPRYFTYNPVLKKYEGETVYIRDIWNEELQKYVKEEAIDNRGGLMLGRPSSKELKELPEWQQQAIRSKIKWQFCVFGIAHFPTKREGVVVELSLTGIKGMEMSEFLGKMKKPWYQNLLILNLDRNQDNRVVPFFRKFSTTLLKDMDDTQRKFIKESVGQVWDYGDTANARIRAEHEKALMGGGSQSPTPKPKASKKKVEEEPTPDPDEVDDEIPF